MKNLTAEQTKQMLISVAELIIACKPMLTEIDNKIGDGDHGIGMEVGMQQARAALLKKDSEATINELFTTMGRAMLMSMGGASGVIFGTMFQGGAKTVATAKELDAFTLKSIFRASLDAVKKRGGAQIGDKTMVDAFEPAVIAMENCQSDDVNVLLAEATEAAEAGVEYTKNCVARFGRAKTLMERSIGYQDAGATSTWLIFRAMRDYTESIGE